MELLQLGHDCKHVPDVVAREGGKLGRVAEVCVGIQVTEISEVRHHVV